MTPKDKNEKTIKELKKEKLDWEIKKLKADTIGSWVKDARALVLLGVFLVVTFTNATILIKNKTQNNSPKMAIESFNLNLNILEGSKKTKTKNNLGVSEKIRNMEDYVMASKSPIESIIGFIKSLFTSHISWQFIAFLFLTPLLIDFIRKRKRKEEV